MSLQQLLEDLSQPTAYPFVVDEVQVRQTHISVVFLAGVWAYKIKKPVNLGFVDFTTPARRKHFCEEEVRLNRRLAADVYHGVVAISRDKHGLKVEGTGTAVEWAVKMTRLPDEATLAHQVQAGQITPTVLESLAAKIAAFHRAAESGAHIADFGRWHTVSGNARENFAQTQCHVGVTVSQAVHGRLRALTEAALAKYHALIDDRAVRHVPRDTHGDLRLAHVYSFPDRPPPQDLVVIDCIEFNERFRYADPVADMAFLVMDLLFRGRRDLAGVFADAYFRAAADAEGRALLPFYTAYRAVVRAKVEGMELFEKEIPRGEKHEAGARARAHWLMALGELEQPERRPCLVLVGGLPGTGKSTLARGLADGSCFKVLRSDAVRKELTGVDSDIYSGEWTRRTYEECLQRAEELLFQGERVVVDAGFRHAWMRALFFEAARRWGVPLLVLWCHADRETVRQRLQARTGDVSDADWSVYQQLESDWEPAVNLPGVHEISTEDCPEAVAAHARELLRGAGLA